ncbi:hypothetical protein MTO96_018316 [Rhipicephalus appendiculatus]
MVRPISDVWMHVSVGETVGGKRGPAVCIHAVKIPRPDRPTLRASRRQTVAAEFQQDLPSDPPRGGSLVLHEVSTNAHLFPVTLKSLLFLPVPIWLLKRKCC